MCRATQQALLTHALTYITGTEIKHFIDCAVTQSLVRKMSSVETITEQWSKNCDKAMTCVAPLVWCHPTK